MNRERITKLVFFRYKANYLRQVMRWIRDTEAMLIASFTIPGCLQEAEQLKKEHEQFQVAIEVSGEVG